MQYCPHCMRPATGAKCPNCGGDVNWTGQKGVDLPVGTQLSGGNGLRTYQIGAARGKGGFGITYIALEINSGRRVAIKEYYPTRCAFRGGNGVDVQAMTGQEEPFQNGMNGFMKEGKMLLSQDDLSCVVHVIDYFQANGTAYLAMEYLDGVPLHTQMTKMGGRIPVNELMPRLALLIRDIGQLHQRGVIHRDISPDNIMWMPDGGLKLLDFGSARSIMESGKSMTVLMKQGFSPIEQYRTRGQGPYTDIYALAATIYYCVTGVIPQSSMERLGEDLLQPPTALGAALTTEQETALLWALSIQPEARPQTMEAFAARLYKEEQPPKFAPTEPLPPSYSAQPGYQSQPVPSQPVPPSQVQPRSAAEGSAVYQYGQSYTGQTAGPSQPAGPGQPIGQYTGPGQNLTGGGGRKKNKTLPIVAAAAAVLVLGIGLVVWWFINPKSNNNGVIEHSEMPSQNTTPEPATARPTNPSTPAPTPTQNVVPGVTDDGFLYEMVGQDHVVITGCETGAKFNYMPDDVDGVPITEIADGAFAGASTGGFVNLPWSLETIGANAFRGCTDLSYIYAYSSVETASSSFSGCDNMWFVAVRSDGASTFGWNLPSGVGLYNFGMATELGTLSNMTIRNGNMLTGATDSGYTVLLDVKSGTSTVTGLDEVDWICSGALSRLNNGVTIQLGEDTLYSYRVYSSRNTWNAPENSLADMWLLTCAAAEAINDGRPSGAPNIEPDLSLLSPAIVRARELVTVNDFTRPDGQSGFTALDDAGVDYGFASTVRGYECYSRAEVFDDMPGLAEYFSHPLTQEDNASYAGEYYSQIGVAYSKASSGEYLYCVFVTIP